MFNLRSIGRECVWINARLQRRFAFMQISTPFFSFILRIRNHETCVGIATFFFFFLSKITDTLTLRAKITFNRSRDRRNTAFSRYIPFEDQWSSATLLRIELIMKRHRAVSSILVHRRNFSDSQRKFRALLPECAVRCAKSF